MGSGSWLLAQITGPAKDNGKGARTPHPEMFPSGSKVCLVTSRLRAKPDRAPPSVRRIVRTADMNHESNQANRAISTSQLNASPRLHIWPINVVVFHGSDREHSFQGGFPA